MGVYGFRHQCLSLNWEAVWIREEPANGWADRETRRVGRRLMLAERDSGVTGVWWHPAPAPALSRDTVGDHDVGGIQKMAQELVWVRTSFLDIEHYP